MKLISMTDFVLEQSKANINSDVFYFLCSNYAQFLTQPLTLGMFIPCDDEGNVLEEPYGWNWFSIDPCRCDKCSKKHDIEALDKYQQAKERVLFEFFEVIHIDKVRITIQHEFQQLDYNRIRERFEHYNTIEDLTGCHLDLTLTPQGIKQIGS